MVKGTYPKRFEIYWINLDPTISSEVKKTRPCVIISPSCMNQGLQTAIVAPMTSTYKNWDFRVPITHKSKQGQVMLDQMRSVSKKRLVKLDGTVSTKTKEQIIDCLLEMFAW